MGGEVRRDYPGEGPTGGRAYRYARSDFRSAALLWAPFGPNVAAGAGVSGVRRQKGPNRGAPEGGTGRAPETASEMLLSDTLARWESRRHGSRSAGLVICATTCRGP